MDPRMAAALGMGPYGHPMNDPMMQQQAMMDPMMQQQAMMDPMMQQ